jgi:hypothetical protein
MAEQLKSPFRERAGNFVRRNSQQLGKAALQHVREAWADIGNTYQNFLWSGSGIAPPYGPQTEIGPEGKEPFTVRVNVEVSVGRNGRISHKASHSSTPDSKAGRVGPPLKAAEDGPDSKINKVGPPKSRISSSAKPNYKDPEIDEPSFDI